MRTKYIASALLALLVAVVCGSLLIQGRAASNEAPAPTRATEAEALKTPFPDIPIPGIPATGECCLWRSQKRIQGARQAQFEAPYACATGATMRGSLRIRMQLATTTPVCDQTAAALPNGSVLVASGRVTRRNDGFMHFIGDFTITNPANVVLFRGTMETIDRIGTHSQPFNCEQCNPPSHFEGWLVGRGEGALVELSLRAMLTARGITPSPQSPNAPFGGLLSGTLIKCS
ncbi:MAG: hypothetical protein QOF02_3651 [Blastocatellia bacterium]|jgi:hypothetical protein|nr:hypothetical protein [Blastocatellia bacterium]